MSKKIRVFLFLALFIGALSGTASAFEGTTSGVYLSDNGHEPVFYVTNAKTVEEFLLEREVQLGEYDEVTPEGYEAVVPDMKIKVDRAITVYIRVDDAAGNIKKLMTKPASVSQVVEQYSKQTDMAYSFDMSIWSQACTENMIVDVYTKRSETFTTTEPISFETQYVDAPEVNEGVETELIAGMEGERSTITRVDYVGKNEVARETVAICVTLEPVDRVILKGTAKYVEIIEPEETALGVPAAKTETPEAAAAAVQQEKPIAQTQQAEPAILQYEKMLDMKATAYTADYESTGKRPGDKYFGITASGMKAQVGVVAVDPKVIPLGTKLYIEGYGYAVAGDTGGAIKGDKIDLFFDTNWECKVYGRQSVTVYILKD